MKDKREFDMLENADDKEVELLAEVPVLTDREKERILKKSKRKLEFLSDDKARERIIKTGINNTRKAHKHIILQATKRPQYSLRRGAVFEGIVVFYNSGEQPL